jgi:RNA polymerase sigma-70 factor (ECF subfamily)
MDAAVQIPAGAGQAQIIVDHFFRHEYGRSISYLTRIFGKENFELIEDAVQESLLKAMQVWPYHTIPQRPSAWILAVAKNKMIDVLRRKADLQDKEEKYLQFSEATGGANASDFDVALDTELKDDQLKMMFACCHPSLPKEHQIILTLKILCGLSKAEIAKALLKKNAAVARTYTRAKTKLKEAHIKLEVPQGRELNQRLEVVLNVLYLLFNEGYSSTEGEALVRKELCDEAIRLTHLLLENKLCQQPPAHALLALMYLQASRLEARTSASGELLTLKEQDRSLWNKKMINYGFYYLSLASEGDEISEYHLQASIAACHCLAKDFASTDWGLILQSYDILLRINSSPVVALNRLVAYGQVHGHQQALKELERIEKEKVLSGYYLFYAIKGELLAEAGQVEAAKVQLKKAIKLTKNAIEKEYLEKKLLNLG